MSAAVIVVSDTCSKDHSQDSVGKQLKDRIEDKLQYSTSMHFVPDEKPEISQLVKELCQTNQLVVTTGGTGLSPRDVTVEALEPLIEKRASGLETAILQYGLQNTPLAALARPLAGFIGSTLVLCVPGSRGGAKDAITVAEGIVPHLFAVREKGRGAHTGGVAKGVSGDAKGASSAAKGVKDASSAHGTSAPTHSSHTRHTCSHGHSHGHGHSGPVFYSSNPAQRPRSSPFPMIPFNEALETVLAHAASPQATTVSISEASGYVLSEDVCSPVNQPPFRASIVDGYAVLHQDCPGTFPVSEVFHAASDISAFERNTCARITTGAPVPHGATAVVAVEDTVLAKQENGKELEITINATNVQSGDNIRDIGSDIRLNELVLPKGTLISPMGGEIGTLASLGISRVPVFKRPVVGVLSTGDEIVDLGKFRGATQTWDANRPMLMAALASRRFEVVDCGIVKDIETDLKTTLKEALTKCDVLITSGGVSMGELDLLKPAINELGGTIHFGRVAMKPGKPATFATINDKVVFALPGNPASSAVCFHVFVLPFLNKTVGLPNASRQIKVRIDFDAKLDPRPEFHRVRAEPTDEGWVASTTGFQRSSRVSSMVAANALLCLPLRTEAQDKLPRGSLVEAMLFE